MKTTPSFSLVIPFLAATVPLTASAVCPICTIAAAGGVEASRLLGIDDAITGLWLGGLTVSLILWTEKYLDKKKVCFPGRIVANAAFYLLLIIVPLYWTGVIGRSGNALHFLGIDRLLFGAVVGAVAFWTGVEWYEFLKQRNNNHAHFPFQKVVMPILPLLCMSVIFYFLTK